MNANPEIVDTFNQLEILFKDMAKKYKLHREENVQLHGLVTAMEGDHKKASRLLTEHERMIKERERMRSKLEELLQKFEKAGI